MKVSYCSTRPVLLPCGLENFDYQIDPYIGCEHYCYYCYVLPRAETNWKEEILTYPDIVGQLGPKLDKIPPQTIYFGYHSDPYQPCEAEHLQTRKVLDLLVSKGFSASILTKSPLVVRDVDILKEMDDAVVSVSVSFIDAATKRLFEARTPETEDRIEALHQLKDRGVKTGALLCPVIPYVTQPMQIINKIKPFADEIWVYGLSVMDKSESSWQDTRNILCNHFPEYIESIEQAIFSKEDSYWQELRAQLHELNLEENLNINIHI